MIKNLKSIERLNVNVSQCFFLMAVIAAIIPFGSARPLPLSIVTITNASLLLTIILKGVTKRNNLLFIISLVIFSLFIGEIFIQTAIGLPGNLVNPVWYTLSKVSSNFRATISIEPADSVQAAMFIAVPFLTFLNGLIVVRSDEDARTILTMLSLTGTLFAVYGLVQFIIAPNSTLIFFTKEYYRDGLTATFVNENTAGTFFGISTLVLLRCCFAQFSSSGINFITLKRIIAEADFKFQNRYFSALVFLIFLLLNVIALFLTKSRGAVSCTFAAVLFFLLFFCYQYARNAIQRNGQWIKSVVGAVLGLGLLAAILITFGGRALLRAETQGADDGRFCVLPGILELAKVHPLFGEGFGTFRYAFPAFRDPQCGIEFVWDHAHNAYLDGFVGMGWLFLIELILGLSALIIIHVHGLRTRRRMRSYSALGLALLILLTLHSLIDFSIEIPGMAAFCAAVLSVTSSVSIGRAEGLRKHSRGA